MRSPHKCKRWAFRTDLFFFDHSKSMKQPMRNSYGLHDAIHGARHQLKCYHETPFHFLHVTYYNTALY